MSKDDALKILRIMRTVDGECPVCAERLFEKFHKAFLNIVSEEESNKILKEYHG